MLGMEVLKRIREQLPQIEYERYFKHLEYDEESSRTNYVLYIAPNLFVANWIKTKYSDLIASTFELITGIRPTVEIATKTQNNKPSNMIIQSSKNSMPRIQRGTILNPAYTFENFVVGSSNQFAFNVSKAVANKPGETYNPLLIYGGTGLGKTHLLNAIGNANQHRVVIYVTSEQFFNEFLYHLRNQTMDRFKERYRTCDFLLIDDIQFFGGKPQIQEEFFHTFNELKEKNKQIVLTADKPPKQIAGIEERLKSRFEWGMVADIQPPERETKVAIIKKKCEMDGVVLSNEVVDYIALNIENNREIEGVIMRLNAYANMTSQEINLDLAKFVLREKIKERRENITLEQIIDAVAKELNVKPSEIKSKSRSAQIANARRVVIYLARTLTPNSMPQLAQFFGMKDHSSISHAMKKSIELIESDADFKVLIEDLKNRIGAMVNE